MRSYPHFILFSFVVLLGFTACENDIEEVNSITSATEKKLPLESGKNEEMLYSDSAFLKARLTAPQLDRYAGKEKNMSYTEMPKGMKVVFYDHDKKEQNKLTADYGIIYDNGGGNNKMEAKRHVVVVNEKGDKMETEHLIWDAATEQIYTEAFVKITTEKEILMGNGLKAKQDFSDYTIINPTGIIQIEDNELTNEKTEEKNE